MQEYDIPEPRELLEVRHPQEMIWEASCMGYTLQVNLEPLNQAVGAGQRFFALIPAKYRFGAQLWRLGELEWQEQQRQHRVREFEQGV